MSNELKLGQPSRRRLDVLPSQFDGLLGTLSENNGSEDALIDQREFRNARDRWNCFSKVDILGSFDFYTLTVSLDALSPVDVVGISTSDFDVSDGQSISMAEYERLKKVLPLVAHEFTHYLDGTATLWGMEHLCRINEACTVPRASVKDFYKLKSLYDSVRRLRLPSYYTTVEKDASAKRPWSLSFTSGREFTSQGHLGDRPIVFGRFLNAQRENLARSPISILSLLETSAMAAELEIRTATAQRLGPERVVEHRLISDDVIEYIYNKNLIEYSVCAHLVANTAECRDVFMAFRMSAFIARFVLNASASTFENAREKLARWAREMDLPVNSTEVILLKRALKHKNHGALFYILATTLPKNSSDSFDLFIAGFKASLGLVGIDFDETLERAERGVNEFARKLENSPLQSLRLIAASGIVNFKELQAMSASRRFEKLNLPPVFLGDMSQYQFGLKTNLLQTFDLEASYVELIALQIRAENLAEACL